MSTPVLFLAFANDPDDHLALLKEESKQVYEALRDVRRKEFIRVEREESLDAEELYRTLLEYRDEVAIFHYGGHAAGTALRLEGGAGWAEGIARLLGEQDNLKLVFLNGCATRGQVDGLMAAGVKAVIATSVSIRDDKAMEFSVRFYQALANRRTIGQAFELAQSFLETKYRDWREVGVFSHRSSKLVGVDSDGEAIPWGLYLADVHRDEVLGWKFPYYRPVGLPQDMIRYIGKSFTANRYVMLVLDEMAKYNPDIYAQMVEQRGGETVKRDSREYPELIIRNFPWPVGSQIRLLRHHDAPGRERLEHLASAYVRTSQLLYYILLSDLWENAREGTLSPGAIESGQPLDAATFGTFDFLAKTIELYRHFESEGVPTYVPEYERVAEAWAAEDGLLRKAHAHLERLRSDLVANPPAGDLAEACLTAEKALAVVLQAAAFLARYRMLTVRNIMVEAHRFERVAYELDMGPLNAAHGGALSLYRDDEHRRKDGYGNSHSIVLVRDEDQLASCLNLSPFIVDKNTFVSVKKSETTEKDRLAHIFVLAFEEDGRLVYLAVDHSIPHALANDGDQIHTGMTREDFTEGRNLAEASASADPFGRLDTGLGLEPAAEEHEGIPVFGILRAQFDSFTVDVDAAS